MRRAVLVLLAVAVALAVATVALWPARDPGPARPIGSPRASSDASGAGPATVAIPPTPGRTGATRPTSSPALDHARGVLAQITERGGAPLPGHVGGREFHNRERKLPPGRYREYDVHPRVPRQDRGPERLVIDQTSGRAYYTGDHYRTFVPLN